MICERCNRPTSSADTETRDMPEESGTGCTLNLHKGRCHWRAALVSAWTYMGAAVQLSTHPAERGTVAWAARPCRTRADTVTERVGTSSAGRPRLACRSGRGTEVPDVVGEYPGGDRVPGGALKVGPGSVGFSALGGGVCPASSVCTAGWRSWSGTSRRISPTPTAPTVMSAPRGGVEPTGRGRPGRRLTSGSAS